VAANRADGLTADEVAAVDRVLAAIDAHGRPARDDLALACRSLANVLARRVPGRSVELRIPPFAAVQVIAGSTHRRGTPPATVEVDPVDWVRLATGRLSWSDAVAAGVVRASGNRSDLSPHLPVLTGRGGAD
jgi:hypothetical protein